MNPTLRSRTLRNLRNTRDLRAEILSMATELAAHPDIAGQLVVLAPVVSADTIRHEWADALDTILPEIRHRMELRVEECDARNGRPDHPDAELLPLDKPNYLYEVLRLLLGASLESGGVRTSTRIAAKIEGTQVGLVDVLGTSITPVRGALAALSDAGLIDSPRSLALDPEALSVERLSRVGALPQTLRFRFERGARIKAPAELLQRAQPLLGPGGPVEWGAFALSGTPVALGDVPDLDLVGTPRLDLVACVPRADRAFDAGVMRLLDDALEPEPNPLAPAPVVVTLVRARVRFEHPDTATGIRRAHPCDVFLALLDMGLRAQALRYARALRS